MIEIGQNLKEILERILTDLEGCEAIGLRYIEVLNKLKELIQCTEGKKSGAEPIIGACCGSTVKIVEYDNKKCPTEAGYYWYKESKDNPTIIRLFSTGVVKIIGSTDIFTLDELNGEFIQPIEPLKEPVD